MRRTAWNGFLAGVVGFAIVSGGFAAVAAPLEKDACDRLKEEQASVATATLRANFSKGPIWAKANLPEPQLTQIARMIELDEQLAFRCPHQRLPPQRGEGAEQPESSAIAAARGPAPSAAPAKPRRAAARPAASAKVDPLSAQGSEAPAAVAEPTTKAPRRTTATKPKAADAYTAPAPVGNAFEGQAQRLAPGAAPKQ